MNDPLPRNSLSPHVEKQHAIARRFHFSCIAQCFLRSCHRRRSCWRTRHCVKMQPDHRKVIASNCFKSIMLLNNGCMQPLAQRGASAAPSCAALVEGSRLLSRQERSVHGRVSPPMGWAWPRRCSTVGGLCDHLGGVAGGWLQLGGLTARSCGPGRHTGDDGGTMNQFLQPPPRSGVVQPAQTVAPPCPQAASRIKGAFHVWLPQLS